LASCQGLLVSFLFFSEKAETWRIPPLSPLVLLLQLWYSVRKRVFFASSDWRGLFMRAAAVALVLILGAAVVLWYANTLNSWVLGGLIGGLAALLLSVPISLTLFSYLSRRHEERLKAEAQEEMSLANLAAYENYLEAP